MLLPTGASRNAFSKNRLLSGLNEMIMHSSKNETAFFVYLKFILRTAGRQFFRKQKLAICFNEAERIVQTCLFQGTVVVV